MRVLIDTHIFIALSRKRLALDYPKHARVIAAAEAVAVSVASFWEIAIKVQLGKLHAGLALRDLGSVAKANSLDVLPVQEWHATALPHHEPPVRDPFDRLLLGVAQREGMRLVTIDRALAGHPLTAMA